ncbi:MAG: hypothetical protein EAX91_18425 [Candidatus Lokiarchaeota archaeon]|nr:hypothetical protein [Candidatus Lokiarchaeota archaeon]
MGNRSRSVGLRVERIENGNIENSFCYIGQDVAEKLHLLKGDILEIVGKKRTAGIVIPSVKDNGKNIIRLNKLQLLNAGAKVGDFIRISKAVVLDANEIELTPTSVESALIIQNEAIKTRLIGKPIVEGNIIDILETGYRESDPENPINYIMNFVQLPRRNMNVIREFTAIVEETQHSDNVVKITRATRIRVNNHIARLDNRGRVVPHEEPVYNQNDRVEYRRIIKNLISYSENLENKIKDIETEKRLVNLERQKLEHSKQILNEAIERLIEITDKLIKSSLLSKNTYYDGGVDRLTNLEHLSKNLNRLEEILSSNSLEDDDDHKNNNNKYCNYCGGEVEDNQIYCRFCGNRL